MELEVFVPVPEAELRRALGDPERVARSVPGLQRAADGEPLEGRLKVRIGGHTITYRGSAKVAARGGAYAIEGEAAEARGSGSVQLALKLRLVAAEGGTTLAFSGGAKADGRAAEAEDAAVESAARRLLTRFAERLGEVAATPRAPEAVAESEAAAETEPSVGTEASVETEPVVAPEAEPAEAPGIEPAAGEKAEAEAAADAQAEAEAEARPEAEAAPEEDVPEAPEEPTSVFDTEVPPPSLDRGYDEQLADEVDEVFGELPTEAAHARRTMIGRSAEEVDHAPPRGRYAPVPAPDSGTASDTLRWVAPAAALVVASAIVVGRVLRRRR
ncbi:SRPBCC domain-containing protein [Streptomyces indicus]|uniref:Carbon monoxide dehydrogenase subunit G n=1 Tax=Streptomyces indicus TaxID=417292 RepID=A0A1G9CG33_9ACTN|nr:SRPBCC domain-containing protein [Streptomyces indicus]SDK50607.1 Carbon monoxide dehydrogenase subunit G [Streptomyces indicus]